MCHKPIKLATVEAHPTRRDLAIQSLECVGCGPVKAKIYSLKPGTSSAELAA